VADGGHRRGRVCASAAERGEPHGVQRARRHLSGYLRGLRGAAALRHELFACDSLGGCLEILDRAAERLAA